MFRLALLDDYQQVALQSADWDALSPECTVTVFHDHLTNESAIASRLHDFDAVMALRERTPFQRSLLARLPNLKLIASAGMRNAAIDLEAATELGIVVSGTEGSSRATMELTWALILGLLRQVPLEHQATRGGAWQRTLGIGLDGKTIGIIGLGNIGSQMAEVARAFHMDILAWSQNLTQDRAEANGATLVSKDDLLQNSDIVTIHTRLSERTRALLGGRELALMKPSAYLVNTSRGPIVDEGALISALRSGTIAGAGLDTFDQEPLPEGHALLGLDNVLLTPHLGYVTQETYRTFYGQTMENIKSFIEGEPQRVMNPEVLDRRR
ncbi:MAG: D-2-hydroxyacid dehydrogenase family protein [Chloroflexi bacterium]|nr:D-2-hydroxyacid dehydrogenase family protein [Chloroflexota bacterium]